MIEIRGLTKLYGTSAAVDDVSLHIPEGQFTVLLGPSGSGKTTLLRMVNRMTAPTSGSVLLQGRDTRSERADIVRRSMG